MARRAFYRAAGLGLAVAFVASACGRSDSAKPEPPAEDAPASAGDAANTLPEATADAAADVRSPALPGDSHGSNAVPPPGAPPPSSASSTSVALEASSAALPAVRRGADASAAFCRPVRGPFELPLRTPAVLVARGDHVDAVLDDDGRPLVTSLASASSASPPGPLPPAHPTAPGSAPVVSRLRCATAGEVAFCPDRSGAIHRASLTGEGDRIVASSRTGARVAAGLVGGSHTVLAYLASRKTSEGWVSESWLEVDDAPPLRLSEDGSGATSVNLASRGGSLLALSVDARTALTAMHVRPVDYDHGVRLGDDAVVFVGGPGDRGTAAVLVLPGAGSGWALLPIAKDMTNFGLAMVRLDDPPRVDEPTFWSMYPNGLDPASVAALDNRGGNSGGSGGGIWVARVRPQTADPSAAHVLELGQVGADGTLTARDVVPTGDSPGDVSLASGPQGDLWLAWVDASGSWVERLACR